MTITKICINCKKHFINQQKRVKFCSQECYFNTRWGAKQCKFCGKKLEKLRYCNAECRNSFWLKNEYQLLKKKRLWERKKEIIEKLGNKCVKCGNSDIRCLDINHIDRTKKGRPKNKTYNMQFRLREWSENINNLELLCANCHRIHTYKQMNYGNY